MVCYEWDYWIIGLNLNKNDNSQPDRDRLFDANQLPSSAGRMRRKRAMVVIRCVIAALVLAALVYTISNAASQLKESEFSLTSIRYEWFLVAVIVYILAMSLSGVFWHKILQGLGQRPELKNSLLAFFTSQLGKYVPGKAMVVILRTDMIRGPEVKTVPAAVSVFVETLTWIFVGSAIASLLLGFQFRNQVSLGATALLLTLAAGVLTWPGIFQWIAKKLLSKKFGTTLPDFSGLNIRLMSLGWFLMTVGWALNGLSLWLVLKGLPGVELQVSDFPLTLACVSLATVAGFVSLLPGGLGVRELVIIPLLGTQFGPVAAVVAAVMIRLVWLAAELLTSGIIYLLFRSRA